MNCPHCQAENDATADTCFTCGKSLSAISQGTVIAGRYEIQKLLGRGGMGMIYKAHDRVLDEVVALKTLRPHIALEADMVRRFRAEIKMARKIRHRNVCAIHDYGEDRSLLYISMEFIDGIDLKQILREEGAFGVEDGFAVAIQAAKGLEAIHEAGVIHRDLKSHNIMRDSKGVIKLLDFGIAKQQDADGGMTGTGQIVGTPEYMSPEQVRGGRIDYRSDLYALGVVMFEIFTGQVPFKGDTPVITIFKHLQEPPPLRGPQAAGLPEAMIPLLEIVLAKDPAQRYSSAGEVIDALRQARASALPEITPTPLLLRTAIDIEPLPENMVPKQTIPPGARQTVPNPRQTVPPSPRQTVPPTPRQTVPPTPRQTIPPGARPAVRQTIPPPPAAPAGRQTIPPAPRQTIPPVPVGRQTVPPGTRSPVAQAPAPYEPAEEPEVMEEVESTAEPSYEEPLPPTAYIPAPGEGDLQPPTVGVPMPIATTPMPVPAPYVDDAPVTTILTRGPAGEPPTPVEPPPTRALRNPTVSRPLAPPAPPPAPVRTRTPPPTVEEPAPPTILDQAQPTPYAPPPPAPIRSGPKPLLIALPIVAVLIGVGLGVVVLLKRQPAPAPSPLPPATTVADNRGGEAPPVTPTTQAAQPSLIEDDPTIVTMPPATTAPLPPGSLGGGPATLPPQPATLPTAPPATAPVATLPPATLPPATLAPTPPPATIPPPTAPTVAARTFQAGGTTLANADDPVGFESMKPYKGDLKGKVDFEVSPSGVRPGDPFTVKVFLVNEGKGAKLEGLTATAGGKAVAGAALKTRDVPPGGRTLVYEYSGTWADVKNWSFYVRLVTKKEAVSATLKAK